jgi:hypothetical protein
MKPKSVTRTFTALPGSWLWPAGPPIWQMSALGAVVALSAVAVPALPTVLPDKPPPTHNPVVAGPVDHKKTDPTPDTASDPTSVPTVSAVVPTEKAGETPSEAPTATSIPPSVTETASPTQTPAEETPATPTDPATGETTAPAVPPDRSVTIAATDLGNQRWLVTGIDCDTCVSGSRIIGIGLLATLTVPVDADAAGPRQLTIAYETKPQRTLYVSVNGAKTQKLTLSGTGGWKQPGWTSLSVDLKAGPNQITFSNPLGLAPDLDQITVG